MTPARSRRPATIVATLSILLALPLAANTAKAASCSIDSVVGVAFGGYDTFAGWPLDSMGSVTFSCSGVGPADTVLIHLSRGGSSSFAPRKLSSAGSYLGYNLYRDAARTLIWGDGTDGTSYYGPVHPSEGVGTTVNVFGRVPAGQNVSVGTYSDAIVVTILY